MPLDAVLAIDYPSTHGFVRELERMKTGGRGLRSQLANLLLALGALLFLFFVLEIGVRLFVNVTEYEPIGVHDIDRKFPIRFRPHTEISYETREFRYAVRVNRFGRRDAEWSPQTIADPSNVLFVGDSFVLGNSVENAAAIPTRLEHRFAEEGRPREVFNFGMPAGQPNTYLALLDHALDIGVAARTVLIGTFVGNDFNSRSLDTDPLRPLPEPSQQPPRKSRLRSELLRFLKLRLSTSTRMVGWAFTVGRLLGIDLYDTAGSYVFLRDPTPSQRETFERVLDCFGQMQELAQRHDRTMRLVIFPNRMQVENADDLTSAAFDAARPNQRILAYCAERRIPCLDLLPVLTEAYERTREPLYFPIDRHLNERGTQVAADAIAAFLHESNALP